MDNNKNQGQKNKGGRPKLSAVTPQSKYKHKYCKDLVEWGKTGKSLELFCKEIKINRRTFYNWIERYPEFAEAKEQAQLEMQDFYEELNRKAVRDEEGVNFNAVQFNLKTRFGFKEKTEQTIIHKSSLAEYIQDYINSYPEDITPDVAKVLKQMLEREKMKLEKMEKGEMGIT